MGKSVYQDFYNFMYQEHGLILLDSEIQEIIIEVEKLKNKLKS